MRRIDHLLSKKRATNRQRAYHRARGLAIAAANGASTAPVQVQPKKPVDVVPSFFAPCFGSFFDRGRFDRQWHEKNPLTAAAGA